MTTENKPEKSFLDDDLNVSNKMAKPRENPPAGPRQFVITHIVAAGTHKEHFPPKAPVMVKKVLCLYELNARRLDGKRFVRNKKWTFSMDEKATMRKDLTGMGIDTSKEFPLKSLVGRNGMENIIHEKDANGGVKVKGGHFMPIMEGIPLMTAEGDPLVLPEWAQVYIAESAEYIQKYGKGAVGPYAEAIKKELERKAGNPQQGSAIPSQSEDDLPF